MGSYIREAKPLLSHQPIFWSGVSKRGIAPLLKFHPLPLIKGKGIKGIGFPNKNLKGVRLKKLSLETVIP